MHDQGIIATRVQIATEIEDGVRQLIHAAKPTPRRDEDTAIGWQRKHVHAGTVKATRPATFAVCIAEALTDGTPTEMVMAIPRFLESVIRRRRDPAMVDLAEAFRREAAEQGAADLAQHDALVTRSEGALLIARQRLYGQRDATDLGIRAIDAELARREEQRRGARAQLQQLQPA